MLMDSNQMNPIVDIGIPAYGDSEFLRETIESVFAQTLDRGGRRSPTTAATRRPVAADYLDYRG